MRTEAIANRVPPATGGCYHVSSPGRKEGFLGRLKAPDGSRLQLEPRNFRKAPTVAAMLLAFETVGRSASVCVREVDGGREVDYADLGGGEAERGLVPLLDRALRRHGRPALLAVAVGPGSFTGLRIGIAAARTLAWLEDLPVAPVDTLAARAAEAGDGLWWVLQPLKRDTTFHGLFRVARGGVEVLAATAAADDAVGPAVLHPDTVGAVAVGPAIAAKPGLAQRWCAGVREGSSAPLSARGVAQAAFGAAAVGWDRLLPAYHQEAAPVLQRQRGGG